jgi:predicted RNA-binding Zn-ribbon protein involved in translation (DUF1610 family)
MPSSIVQQCPSCARVIHFSHDETTILQCVCGTVINRKEGGLLLPKPFYLVQNPGDLIQPGTGGKWQEKTFTVLGRFRAWFDASVFNYWTILFDDGELAYLGEGYGLYSILRKTTVDRLLTASYLAGMTISSKRDLVNGEDFLLEKCSRCHKWEAEGEVWLPECNSNFAVYDFAAQNGRRITLFQFLQNLIVPFEGTYVSYTELQLTNTRPAEFGVKSFTCNHCENKIEVRTYPFAKSCACPNCGLQYVLREDGFKSTDKYPSLDTGLDITLGCSGEVKGITYEVIGYALKEENNQYHAQWKEYTLYNREEGYAFLSEYEGHWVYVRERGAAPVLKSDKVDSFVYGSEDFQLYNAYSFTIRNARGEFPNNLFLSESTYCKEFISPPEVWIREQNKGEGITWFLGEHVSGKDLEKSFDMPAGAPYKTGIGAVEPKFFIAPYKLVRMAFIGVLFLVALHLLITTFRQNRVILDQEFSFSDGIAVNDTTQNLSFVSKPFHLDKWRSNLELHINAPVDNDWFELGATLVNKTTGAEYSLEKGVEYYHGYTDGENWTEGGTAEDAYLTQIPAGDYVLQLQGIRSPTAGHVNNFHVMATYDVPMERNLFFSILLLLVWPVVQYIRTNKIEKKRWYNSPFSPFSYED